MDMRRIGSLEVTVIGLGTNNFGYFMEEDAVPPVVDAALDAGINFSDTADSYLENVAAGEWRLTPEEVAEIDALAPPASHVSPMGPGKEGGQGRACRLCAR